MIYRNPDDDNQLYDTWDLKELYEQLRTKEAIAIPHHTAYKPGFRGKDWNVFDPTISPIMEIFSCHGSSESIFSPVPMEQNPSMGPRTSGGTLVDALDSGHKMGVIGSNDQHGLAGGWGKGVAAIIAEDLTRESLWESILQRRTYASTGERIKMGFKINGKMMGSTLKISDKETLNAEVSLDCPQALDRVDLIYNGNVLETYIHNKNHSDIPTKGVYKILIECGWGAASSYGFSSAETANSWDGNIDVENGKIKDIIPRFSNYGQKYEIINDDKCSFLMKTSRDGDLSAIEGIILEVEGDYNTRLKFDIEGEKIDLTIGELINKDYLKVLLEESETKISKKFGIQKNELENPDVFYHNARKIKISPAYHEDLCSALVQFKNIPFSSKNLNYYYVRASQRDGQTVWSSPIWIEA